MNDITYAVSVDVNNPIIPYNVYVASVLDSNVRYLEITLYQNGNVIALSNTATATASLVTDNVLVDDSVNCTISDNIITVPLEDLQRHGNLDVQVTVTEGTKVLAIPFPIQIRVTPNIAEEAQIDENSMGSYAEVVQEIADARRGYNNLNERINNAAAPTDEQVAEAVEGYFDEHPVDVIGKENTVNKKTSISNQSQTGDSDTFYPTVGAVRDFVNYVKNDTEDYIDEEIENIGSAKADKATTLAGYGITDGQTKIDPTHKLSSDLVDDTNKSNKFVTSSEKTAWGNKYDKPSGGIPKTDLSSAVQTSLGKADSALQTPSGGTVGQVLTKTASAAEWKDIPNEYEFVNEIPQNADHSQKYVLPDGYIYEWQQGSPSVPYNANTRLINQSPKLNTDKDTLESRSGVLVSDLIPYGRDWKYSEDGRVYLSGISQIVPVYYSSLIVYYYRRDTGAYIGTLQSAQLSSMNHPANNAPISLPVSLKVSDPAIAFSGVDVSDPGEDIGYVRILLGISTQGNITENDVKDLVINVPFYDTPSTPDGWVNTGIKHPYYIKDSIFDVSTDQVLYAVGDSITYGYGVGGNNYSWVKHVIDHNGYAAYGTNGSKNLGENNLGFCTNSTSSFGNHSIQDVVDGTSFAGADVVTVALGINDWKNASATLANFWSGMQYCFNKIRSDNPYCKIYYILPFNVSFAGSYSTFYGLGFKGDSDTTKCYAYKLQEFINLIKAKFEEAAFKAYRVELIDMTECAAINRQNITTALIDDRSSGGSDYGLHPTAATHAVLGKEIARIIAESHIVNAEPIKVSQLTNDSGYLTLATLPIYNGGVQ